MRLYFLLPVVLCLLAFVPGGKKKKNAAVETIDVPGVVQIDPQTAIDQTEITNFNWIEYLYWTSNIYGRSSAEYAAILPDTSLWNDEPGELDYLADHYLRHPVYRDYPVVGLTYTQMTAFCNWRSDRVLEYALIKTGRIAYDTAPTPQTFFTTEKYLAGNYLHYAKDPSVRSVPHFYLPSPEEWRKADAYSREVYERLSERRRKKGPDAYYASIVSGEKVLPVAPDRRHSVKGALYNLNRNVSEQLSDPELAAGANWKQGASPAEEENTHFTSGAAVTKGFRCAFRWKPVE